MAKGVYTTTMKILFLMLKVRQDFSNSFTVALENIGEVKEYNYLEKEQELGRDRMNKDVIELVESYKPDITICIMYQDQIHKETFKMMSKLGTKVLGWFCDDRARFYDYSSKYAPYLDYSITTDYYSMEGYNKIGCKAILSQWGSTPELFAPLPFHQEYDVSFIGGPHGGRQKSIEIIENFGIKVKWFGKDKSTYLDIDGQNMVISKSKINLNFCGNSRNSHIKQIKTRFFEITAAGGFLLSEYAPKIEDYFVIGREIETFTTLVEAVRKIKRYLVNEDKRNTIRKNGFKRSINDHTYYQRFLDIFKEVGVNE